MNAIHTRYSALAELASTRARTIVWGIWAVMLLTVLICIAVYGRNIPLAEDWYLVAPYTGNEPDFWGWLWAQNNEHRIPLPRLILLGLLWLTQGDFRAGMVCSVLILAATAAGMVATAQYLRGGQTKLVDAFFPIAFLHLGDWENMVWGWQLSFVFPTALIFVMLLVMVTHQRLASPTSAILMAMSLIVLPFCGANGLLFVPFFAIWSVVCGVLHWQRDRNHSWIRVLLFGAPVIALVLIGLYFIGYERPTWNPPSPGLAATLKTSVMFLTYSFGAGVSKLWAVAIPVTFVILASTVWLLIQTIVQKKADEKVKAIGLTLFLGNLFLVALAIGWGRAGLVPEVGLPMRYVLLSMPTLCLSFFAWELYGKPKTRQTAQSALLIFICLLLPFNTLVGAHWRNWYVEGMSALERDLANEASYSEMAHDHREFLIRWWKEDKLETNMKMLSTIASSPFSKMNQ